MRFQIGLYSDSTHAASALASSAAASAAACAASRSSINARSTAVSYPPSYCTRHFNLSTQGCSSDGFRLQFVLTHVRKSLILNECFREFLSNRPKDKKTYASSHTHARVFKMQVAPRIWTPEGSAPSRRKVLIAKSL